MKPGDIREGARILRAVLSTLALVVTDHGSDEAAELRRLAGKLDARIETAINDATIGEETRAVFDQAQVVGLDAAGVSRLRNVVESTTVTTVIGQLVATLCERLILVAFARVVADTTYESRTDVDEMMNVADAFFDPAIEFASDIDDLDAFRDLTTLHASVVRRLSIASRPLPRVSTYSYTMSLPSLTLAGKLYNDADREDELIAENKVWHPLFMPPSGRALSK